MSQLELKLLARIDGPSVVPPALIVGLSDYRHAVRECWNNRRIKGMTRATLAELTGMRASHISDYLDVASTDKRGKERRDMPAKYIRAFEAVCGNTFVSQFVAMESNLTVMEAVIAQQKFLPSAAAA